MGADAFIAFYGVKIAISQTDEDTLNAVGARTEPRLRDARQHGLHVYWGRLTDGQDYFLSATRLARWELRMIPIFRCHSTSSPRPPSACKLDS